MANFFQRRDDLQSVSRITMTRRAPMAAMIAELAEEFECGQATIHRVLAGSELAAA